MSHAEIFRRGVEAFNRGDVEAVIEVLDPDIEWHDIFAVMLGGEAAVYWGHEGARQVMRDLHGTFVQVHTEYPEIRDVGDRTVAIGFLRARGDGSGAELESDLVSIAEWRDGRATYLRTYLDIEEGLKAAGLSE